MLVNIWASIIHLADTAFCNASAASPSLDLLICQEMGEIVKNKQTWMINPCWKTPGNTGVLLRESYGALKGGVESYLVLYTPGYADIILNVPMETLRLQLQTLCARALIFRKHLIGIKLGTPSGTPNEIQDRIQKINALTAEIILASGGQIADLSDLAWEQWNEIHGSRLTAFADAAKRIAQAILLSHPEPEAWKNL